MPGRRLLAGNLQTLFVQGGVRAQTAGDPKGCGLYPFARKSRDSALSTRLSSSTKKTVNISQSLSGLLQARDVVARYTVVKYLEKGV